MPGYAILQRLEPPSYDAFFQLIQHYTEALVNVTVSIYMACDLIDTHLKRLGDAAFHEPAYRDALEEVAEENAQWVQELTGEIRQFFWYDPATDERLANYENTHNRARWSPYDGAAWDRFWAEIVAHFTPLLRELEQRLAPLEALERLDQHPLDAEKAAKIKGIKHRLIDEALQRFHLLLDAEAYAASLQE